MKTQKPPKTLKTKELANQLQEMQLLGEIICWNARSDKPNTYKQVLEALDKAKLDREIIKEFKPQHAFSRACRKLSDERLIDITKETGEEIEFQFTKKSLEHKGGSKEWSFNTETFLTLNKITAKVKCDNKTLQQYAQENLDKCLEERTTSDITKIIQKLFELNGDLFPIRDQGGVYFVPQECTLFTNKIETFLKELGGAISRFPVPAGTQLGNKAVQESVTTALESLIKEHNLAIDSLNLNTRQDTIEHAAEKIKSTKVKIEAYAHYLEGQKEELLNKLKDAQVKLKNQIHLLAKEKENSPQTNEERTLFFGYPPTAVIRLLGKEMYDFAQAQKLLKFHQVQVADATIRAQLQAGRTGTRGDPANLTPEQKEKLLAPLKSEHT